MGFSFMVHGLVETFGLWVGGKDSYYKMKNVTLIQLQVICGMK